MSLFKKAEPTSAFLKMGLFGLAGSGKTYTATQTAIGMVKLARERGLSYAKRPIYFLDTEKGVDWVAPLIKDADIELSTAKTRAFKNLLVAVEEAERDGSLLLVDSLTHFWVELCESHMRVKNRTRLQFEDWAFLKSEWRKFTDRFINSNLHIIVAGRAGYEYDYVEDEETGRKNLEKTDVKMKAEGEMGYEPSLLVLMKRKMNVATNEVWRTASVLKDRATKIDGKEFRNPTFENFLPHVQFLNLGGVELGVDATNSDSLIPADTRDNTARRRRIALGDIQDLLILHIPGMSQADKQRKINLCHKHFDAGWTEMEEAMGLEDLRAGLASLRAELEPHRAAKAAATPIDAIPFTGEEAATADPARKPDTPAPQATSLVADQLADTIVKNFEDAMEQAHTKSRAAQIWKDNEGAYHKLDEPRQGKMLLIKQWAETRIMLDKENAKQRALRAADATAARTAAQ